MRIPPLLLAIVLCAISVSFDHCMPLVSTNFPAQRPVAVVLGVAGICILLASARQFRLQDTTVNPMMPEQSSALVNNGIYLFSRNPMYLGMALELIAVGIFVGSLGGFVGSVLFVTWMTAFQIPAEEQALRGAFGSAYDDYAKNVRRWI